MKKLSYILYLMFFLYSCSDKIPMNYGIYASSNHELHPLKSQSTIVNGNLLESISGLKGTSGTIFDKLDYIIVYKQDVKADDIKLSKLYLNRGSYVRNLFGSSYVELNLWTVEKTIEINVSPIENKKDMYKVTMVHPIENGFYAIDFGTLTNRNTASAFNKAAYDFVIGNSVEPYRSAEEIQTMNIQEFSANAERLLSQVNDLFNKKDYNAIRKIYHNTDGNEFNDSSWNSMIDGFKNWSSQAGAIKFSKIIGKSVNENYGTFALQTEYEKVGQVNEELRIQRKDGSYFITLFGSN